MPTSLLFDFLSYLTRDASFVQAALYTMAVGLAAALLAIPTGLAQYVDIDRRIPARRVAAAHMRLNFLVTALFAANLTWRLFLTSAARTPTGPFVLSLLGVVLLMRSSGRKTRLHIWDRPAEDVGSASMGGNHSKFHDEKRVTDRRTDSFYRVQPSLDQELNNRKPLSNRERHVPSSA